MSDTTKFEFEFNAAEDTLIIRGDTDALVNLSYWLEESEYEDDTYYFRSNRLVSDAHAADKVEVCEVTSPNALIGELLDDLTQTRFEKISLEVTW